VRQTGEPGGATRVTAPPGQGSSTR
jgi:hypothetical protein